MVKLIEEMTFEEIKNCNKYLEPQNKSIADYILIFIEGFIIDKVMTVYWFSKWDVIERVLGKLTGCLPST